MCPASSQVAKLPFVINDGQWHHICITWTTRDGVWEAYQDGTQGGNGENLAPYHPIKPQGVLVLGQEQVLAWELGGCRLWGEEPQNQRKDSMAGGWPGDREQQGGKEPRKAGCAAAAAGSLPCGWEWARSACSRGLQQHPRAREG